MTRRLKLQNWLTKRDLSLLECIFYEDQPKKSKTKKGKNSRICEIIDAKQEKYTDD